MKRRQFIKTAASAFFLLQGGSIMALDGAWADEMLKKKTLLRFAVASDVHYGQAGTEFRQYLETMVDAINQQHAIDPFEFCVINGDIVHDDRQWLPEARKQLDRLAMPWYVSQGNHDHVTEEEWMQTWKMPVNHDFRLRDCSILIGTTSNERGQYLCPDLTWMTNALESHRGQEHVFIFVHITPNKWTKYGVDCPQLHELFSKHGNIRAVFNGHDHDQDGIKMKGNIPFLFDSHVGGDWGTGYHGFRVVELKKNKSLFTYILNPVSKINIETIRI